MPTATALPTHLDTLLLRHLHAALPDLEPEAIDLLRAHLSWVEIPGGATLMAEGEPGDAMYLLVSGRLRTFLRQDDGTQRVVREIGRGEVVGEMSLYTDEPRSATLVAIRDSVLVRLGKEEFRRLLALSAQASIALTRQIIQRLQTQGERTRLDRPVTLGLVPISAGIDLPGFAHALALALQPMGRVAVVDAATLDRQLAEPGITARPGGDVDANRRIALRLDEIEAAHEFVLLLADDTPTPWTQRCTRHSDELLLLADADAPPEVHPTETACLAHRPPRTDATEVLLLLHPADRDMPRGTARWLARRPVADHVHLRRGHAGDLARLARLQSRTATGLVLAGGGARGLAHLGVYRALRERGVEIDVVGGTSIGSVMATLMASDRPWERMRDIASRAFASKPTSDFNWLPLMSLIRGRRLKRVVSRALDETMSAGPGAPGTKDGGRPGHQADLEDLWKGCFGVATNYSRACEQVLRRGPLLPSLLAGIAIPGALPPVIMDGDLLCDGGTFNNFPVDVMAGWRGVGRVVGVDLGAPQPRKLEIQEIPGSWALLRDRLRPRGRKRYKLPSLVSYLVNVTILYSLSRQRQARAGTQLYFHPPLHRVGMLEWQRFDEIVQTGYIHALQVLDAQAQGQQHGTTVHG